MCRPVCQAESPAARLAPTVGEIVRTYGDAYRAGHALCPVQAKALHAIARCRTAALGGHLDRCAHCGAEVPLYNRCDNRHCPQCQTLARLRWIQDREAELLPVPYFHVVFTLPHALNPRAQANPALIYCLLFRAAADTLKAFGRDPKHLGAELGIVMVLHTWGQTLVQHIHVHCIVTGGGLSLDGSRWIPCKRNPHSKKVFLFPVKALSPVFRGKFLEALQSAFDHGELRFAGDTAPLADPREFAKLATALHERDWVVYAKRPFAGPEQVIRYLGAYTHKVAIGNHRLISIDDGEIRFRYKDYAHGDAQKTLTLAADEFIRRFLLHILPQGFQRVRYYGFLANRYREEKLARCRELLGAEPPTENADESPADLLQRIAGLDVTRCPVCHRGHLFRAGALAEAARGPPPTGPPERAP